jgi:hypothetical protein
MIQTLNFTDQKPDFNALGQNKTHEGKKVWDKM